MKICKLLILMSSFLFAQTLLAQNWTVIENWKYIAQDDNFWNLYESKYKKNIPAETLEYVFDNLEEKSIENIEDAEYFLALAESLQQNNFIQSSYLLYINLIKKHPGSFVSQKSLVNIAYIFENNQSQLQDYDEEELQQVINQAAFKDIPYAAANMLHYFTAIDNIEKSLDAWARKSLQAIEVKSYWHSRLRYAKALQAYAKNNLTQAEDILSSLASSSNIPENLLWKVQLQRARILFEQRKYYAADQIYKNTKFPPRIFGRVLLERAWAQYYLKDYSMSLGLLESLKTPALSYASDPEQYLLAMIIYREVCHYPKVALLSEEFKKRYQDTYTKILKNKNFHENFVLVWQKLNGQAYREKADVYDALNKEQQLWQDAKASYKKSEAGKYILSLIERKLQDFDLYLKRFMMEDLKSEANRFLEYWDYIKLADYVSKLDEYRIKPMFENRKYSINLEDKRSFNTLYWPVSGEYWKEEFPYYQVLLSDRCEMNESGGVK